MHDSIHRERLNQRRGDASDADWAVHTEIVRRWEDLTPQTQAMTRRVDTSGTKEAAVLAVAQAG